MPRTKLTAASVKRLKPPPSGQVDYFDEILPSFGLRVSKSGVRSWFVMTRVDGKLVRFTLGRFPVVDLSGARKKARETITLAQSGLDPRQVAELEREKRRARQRHTFEGLANEFQDKHVLRNLSSSTAREYRRILFGPDTRWLHKRPISDIKMRDVRDVIEAIEDRGSTGAADRAVAYLRKFFNWCVDREIIESSPVSRIRSAHTNCSRERVLSDLEIEHVWSAFGSEPYPFGPLFKLLLLTGQRRGEVGGMLWSEFRELNGSDPIWEIPSSRTKNKRSHLVPLSPSVVALIEQLPRVGPFVFSTTGTTSVSGFGRAMERVRHYLEANFEPVGHWTLHDLRRTMVTIMNEKLRLQPHVVEAVVNHVSGSAKRGVAGVYNRAVYLEDRTLALNAWASYLEHVVTAVDNASVLSIASFQSPRT